MQLTTEKLIPFIGGQLEIQNPSEGYLYRGEIAQAEVVGNDLKVRFAWIAKNDGGPSRPSPEWTVHDTFEYDLNLLIYRASDISMGRIGINSSFIGELAVFFPKGYTNLDGEEKKLERSRVKGL